MPNPERRWCFLGSSSCLKPFAVDKLMLCRDKASISAGGSSCSEKQPTCPLVEVGSRRGVVSGSVPQKQNKASKVVWWSGHERDPFTLMKERETGRNATSGFYNTVQTQIAKSELSFRIERATAASYRRPLLTVVVSGAHSTRRMAYADWTVLFVLVSPLDLISSSSSTAHAS